MAGFALLVFFGGGFELVVFFAGGFVVGAGTQFGMDEHRFVAPGMAAPSPLLQTIQPFEAVVVGFEGVEAVSTPSPSSPSSSFGSKVGTGHESVVTAVAVMSQPRISDELVVVQLDVPDLPEAQETQ